MIIWNMKHIKETIKQKAKRIIPGREIKCRCGNQATIVLREGRYFVVCSFCGNDSYLKEF